MCFSLENREIRPSAVFGTRRKNVLRGASYAWTPDFGSFFKLLEVGFLPTWFFIPSLSVFQCFGWFKAVRGRLIGPRTWDRIIGIFFRNFWRPFLYSPWVGAVWVKYVLIYVLNGVLVCIRPEMAVKSGFTK